MLLVAVLVALHTALRPDRVVGWGGEAAALLRWVGTFHEELVGGRLTAFEVSRSLPSATLCYALRAVGVRPDEPGRILAFAVWDALLLLVVALAWRGTARRLSIGVGGAWVGLAALLLGHPVLKDAQALPYTTDTTALALGSLAVLAYVAGSAPALLALAVAGAFTWPTALPVTALLLVLPRGGPTAPGPRAFATAGAALGALAFLAFVHVLLRRGAVDPFAQVGGRAVAPMVDLLLPSQAIAAAALFLGLRGLLDRADLAAPRALLDARLAARAALCVGVALAARAVQQALSDGRDMLPLGPGLDRANGVGLYLEVSAYRAVARPAAFLVAHAAYFGPLVLLLLLRWRRACEAVRARGGPGLALALVATLFMALDSESRHLVHGWPLVVPFAVLATEDLWRSPVRVAAVVALGVVGSGVWRSSGGADGPARVLAAWGPWMSATRYTVTLLVLLPVGAALWALCRRAAAEPVSPASGGSAPP